MQTISVRRTLAQLARQPLYWAGLAALLALGYAYAMGTSAVGVDDLAIATYQQGGGFLRQSRITEWLVQALTGLLAYQRFWPEFWAAVCLALAGTGLAAVVYTAAARTPTAGGALLLAGAFPVPCRGLRLFQPLHHRPGHAAGGGGAGGRLAVCGGRAAHGRRPGGLRAAGAFGRLL